MGVLYIKWWLESALGLRLLLLSAQYYTSVVLLLECCVEMMEMNRSCVHSEQTHKHRRYIRTTHHRLRLSAPVARHRSALQKRKMRKVVVGGSEGRVEAIAIRWFHAKKTQTKFPINNWRKCCLAVDIQLIYFYGFCITWNTVRRWLKYTTRSQVNTANTTHRGCSCGF